MIKSQIHGNTHAGRGYIPNRVDIEERPRCRPVHRSVAAYKGLDTYDNGRQWKRICKTSGNSEGIGNFFLFLRKTYHSKKYRKR